MASYADLRRQLARAPKSWLVTGAAGFIGSHLVESLLRLGQDVVGIDNFATGKPENLEHVRLAVGENAARRFHFFEGDIRSLETCRRAATGVDYILHQAAIVSVPRSIEDPVSTHLSNVDGFLNMLVAARDSRVKKFVYASSSSVYGDNPDLPKREETIGNPLSPYAATKRMNEMYAQVFHFAYHIPVVGIRYFNVFGSRQDPNGPYAAVIPKWLTHLIRGESVFINGTGETSRDFTDVSNVVQINLLAALSEDPKVLNQVFNCASSVQYPLTELLETLKRVLSPTFPHVAKVEPCYREFRDGDVLHSFADISKSRKLLGYEPSHTLEDGLRDLVASYLASDQTPR